MKISHPIPLNEAERLWALTEFDVDYSAVSDVFKDLTTLAAKVAGTEISLINLIDSFTQWTISGHGLDIDQMAREDSVCQYTITAGDKFEVLQLSKDLRFQNKFYVLDEPKLEYYFGVPLTTDTGYNLGALCVLDKSEKTMPPEKVELLKIIAKEVVNRLVTYKVIEELKNKISTTEETQKKVVHDIRGPISGIIGITKMLKDKGEKNSLNDVLDLINMINKAGTSLLELVTEILETEDKIELQETTLKSDEFNLELFKEKLEKLYSPQAKNKAIDFVVTCTSNNLHVPFRKNKLLQITGNLITNAIKFTPDNGSVNVELSFFAENKINTLQVIVKDSGIGLHEDDIEAILKGEMTTTTGTEGEKGFGFGLAMVKKLIDSLNGTMAIESEFWKGTKFIIKLPFETILDKG